MIDAEWVTLSERDYDYALQQKPDSSVTFSSSPYAVPRAVRAFLQDGRRVIVEFKYIAPEDGKKDPTAVDGVVTVRGVNSGRLQRLELDLDSLTTAQIRARLSHAVATLATATPLDAAQEMNLHAARVAIERKGQQMLESAAG